MCSIQLMLSLCSVNAAKKSLMNESEDGARLQTEKKELEYHLNQLRETHKLDI